MKMKRNILLAAIFTFVFMLFISNEGYSAPKGIKRGITDDTIKIGAIMDLTGMASATTSTIVEAFRNFANHVNDNGGIHGRKLKVIAEDDRFTISGGVAAFKKLVYRDNIFLLLGPGSSGESAALKNQFIKEKLPTVPFSANQDLVRPFERYIFLPVDTFENQIGVILDYILETTKIKNPKIVNAVIDTGSKTPVLETFRTWEKYWGIKVRDMLVPLNVLDTTSEILTLKREGADYIIVTHTIPCAALFLKDAKRYGLDAMVYGTNSLTSEDVIRIAGPLAKNFYGVHSVSSWYDDTPGVAEMKKITLKYRPGTEEPLRSKNYTIGWLVMTVFTEGMKRAGRDIDNENYVDALETINNFDTQGLAGPVTYTSNNHEGIRYDRIFHADPEQMKLIPVSKWRRAPGLK